MLFNSNIFLFVYLPITLVGYLILLRFGSALLVQLWLGALSLVFYAASGLEFLPILAVSICWNYTIGWIVAGAERRWVRSTGLAVGITVNLLLLSYFKYAIFLAGSIEGLTGITIHLPEIVLPVGISFYTFTQIAFLVDASRREAAEYDPARYVLFVTFFPHLVAGPIIHHKEMMPQFARLSATTDVRTNLAVGLFFVAIGLAKKCLIADPLGSFCSPIFDRAEFDRDIHFFIAWAAALAYTFQIYFDFSGYSDMAIGLARMFGVKFPANFNSPYKSRDIVAFWRRWHMTLSRFLRDYLYIPLGGNRRGTPRRYVNLMITMLIGGLWHGAAWTFVAWGALHGSYLVIAHAWENLIKRGLIPALLRHVVATFAIPITFVGVVIAWVLFRSTSFEASMNLYEAMFFLRGLSLPVEFADPLQSLGIPTDSIELFAENSRRAFYLGCLQIAVAAFVAFALPNSLQIARSARPTTDFSRVEMEWTSVDRPAPRFGWRRIAVVFSTANFLGASMAVYVAIVLFLSVRAINAAAETEFLYFQF